MPTIREQFEQAKADFASAYKSGDAEKAKQAGELAEKLETVVKMADEKGAKLNRSAEEVRHGSEPKGFGEWAAKSLDLSGAVKGEHFSTVTADGYKAASTPTTMVTATNYNNYADPHMYGVRRRLQVRDLFGAESRDATSISWLVESDIEGDTKVTTEGQPGGQYHQSVKIPTTASLKKVFGFYKESWEITQDEQWLASSLQNRGLYIHDLKVEDQLINGGTTGTNLSGILKTNGIQTGTATESTLADGIFKAISDVSTGSGLMADAIVMNPTEYQTLRLAKDRNDQYLGGGYFSGQYGNGQLAMYPDVWGLTTVVTPAIAAGTVLVGAFKLGASVFTKAGEGLRVEMTNSDSTDFEFDLVCIRIIERLELATRYPAAFEKITVTASA